jgi:hypothetical protein
VLALESDCRDSLIGPTPKVIPMKVSYYEDSTIPTTYIDSPSTLKKVSVASSAASTLQLTTTCTQCTIIVGSRTAEHDCGGSVIEIRRCGDANVLNLTNA